MDLRIFTEPQQGAAHADLLAVARAARDGGFSAFFRSDHVLAMNDDGLPGPSESFVSLGAVAALGASAQEAVLNLYSARHYQTDEALYANFTKATGIRINRVEADDAGILARLKAEGSASPADVILLVDAARLWRGEQEGLFQPVKSTLLEQRIPAQLRGSDNGQGPQWFGVTTRARIVVYDKARIKPADVDSYEKLAAPALGMGPSAMTMASTIPSPNRNARTGSPTRRCAPDPRLQSFVS